MIYIRLTWPGLKEIHEAFHIFRVFQRAESLGTSLVVHWLALSAFTAGGSASVPDWGTKIPKASRCGPEEKFFKKQKFLIFMKSKLSFFINF